MEAFTAALVSLLALVFSGAGLYGLWLDYQQDLDPDLRAAGILPQGLTRADVAGQPLGRG